MGKLSIFSRYIPTISKVSFDAEFDLSINDTTKITSYPLENGYNVTNGIIHMPVKFKMKLAVGTAPLTSFLTDHVDKRELNGGSLVAGLIANITDSGLANYALGLVSENLFKSYSRGGDTYELLQALKLTGKPFNMAIHDLGMIKNVLISSINTSRKPVTADIVFYEVSFQQLQTGEKPPAIDTASERVNMGEAKVSEEI